MLAVGSPAADLTAKPPRSAPSDRPTGTSKLVLDALELLKRAIGHVDRRLIANARQLLEQDLDVLIRALPRTDHGIKALVRMIVRDGDWDGRLRIADFGARSRAGRRSKTCL